MKKYLYIVALIFIFGINLLVRVTNLDKSPSGLVFDEAALGYNAYSILKTGKDEYGNFLPLSLRSFNDYKPALYAYFSIPFIKAWGLNEVSTRVVSALAGFVSTIFLFLILKKFVKDKKLLIFIFFLLSLQPWRLHFSRTAFESNLSAMFFVGGCWLILENMKRKKTILSFLTVMMFALSCYGYHSARVAAPLLILACALDPLKIILKNKFKINIKKSFVWILLGLLLLISPIFLFNNESKLVMTRFRQENVFKRYYPFTPLELVSNNNPWMGAMANPLYYFGGMMSGRFISVISPVNLGNRVFHWVRGSPQYIPDYSMLGWIESMVLAIGLIIILKYINKVFEYRFLVYWMVAGTVPAAVTWNWYHPLRSLNVMACLEIIVAIGFCILFKKLKNTVLVLGLMGLLLVTVIFTINNEIGFSSWANHGEYQPGGFREGMPILMKYQKNADQVLIDSPHAQAYIFFLFYQSFPPEIVQKYASIRPKPGIEGNLNFNFDKYIFRDRLSWPSEKFKKNTVFWTGSEVKPEEINSTPGSQMFLVDGPIKNRNPAVIIVNK